MKKRICLVTNWYPTKENPYQGLFFKEQAFAVEKEFDFLVLHYYELVKRNPRKVYSVTAINEERNTKEFNVFLFTPIFIYLWDAIYDFWQKKIKKQHKSGVGRYLSPWHERYTEKKLAQIYHQYFEDQFDVLYCVDGQFEAGTLAKLSKCSNKPYVVGEHSPFPLPGFSLTEGNLQAMENANLYLAISNDKIRQILLQNVKLPKTVYIGNLIDENQLTLSNKVQTEEKTILIVAAHSFYKNYDLFIQTINRLCEITDTPFKVMIVGYGSNKGYSSNVEQFEQQIQQSKFAKCVEMIPAVAHSEIQTVYHKADCFVMTSIQEGQPVSAMEAACCGLPIFSTRCGGVEDYVDEKMGRIVAVTDYEALAQYLKEFVEGSLQFDSQYIREQVVGKFGREAFTKTFVDSFNSVIK